MKLCVSPEDVVVQPYPQSFRRLSIATAVASLVLVAVGGAVRATDSGLACPTWPGCFTAGDFIPPADLNVWLEHTHRLVAGVVAIMIAAQLVWVLARFRDRRAVLWASVAASVLVIAQALLGAVVVLLKLRAELVTAHLGMAMALVGLLLYLAVLTAPGTAFRPDRLTWTAAAAAAVTYAQILVGGHTSGTASGLVYADRPLLGVFSLTPLATEQQVFNVLHRVLALWVVAAVMIVADRARRDGATGWAAGLPRVAAWLVGLQIVVGVANLASGLSFVTVIPHLAIASWTWAALVLEALLAARTPAASAVEPAPTAVGASS
jgi:cytochrome c oxidase assembly protein subunit 15